MQTACKLWVSHDEEMGGRGPNRWDADLYADLRRQITMLFWFGAPFEHQVDDEH